MAKPIEPTPILHGKDAKNFLKDFDSTKLTPSVEKNLERCERLYTHFQNKLNTASHASQYRRI